ncbi:hypothetical protein [Flavobacterium sp.]|uniref:hypothetical protein n=1 Tax=Flavobacterium sp. TaxID=239 RepID=UPI0026378A4D|nr:hypothetical protein [Flavobacterium sp.]
MRKLLLLLTIQFLFFSCEEKLKSQFPKFDSNGTRIVYNEEEYSNLLTKNNNIKVITVDTFCENSIKRVKSDIKKGKLVFFNSNNLILTRQISDILKKYGIETRTYARSCIRLNGFNPYCYQDLMNEEVVKKYGPKFIDSITELAKRNYVVENPDKVLMENGKDLREKYLNKNISKN